MLKSLRVYEVVLKIIQFEPYLILNKFYQNRKIQVDNLFRLKYNFENQLSCYL